MQSKCSNHDFSHTGQYIIKQTKCTTSAMQCKCITVFYLPCFQQRLIYWPLGGSKVIIGFWRCPERSYFSRIEILLYILLILWIVLYIFYVLNLFVSICVVFAFFLNMSIKCIIYFFVILVYQIQLNKNETLFWQTYSIKLVNNYISKKKRKSFCGFYFITIIIYLF